MDPGCNGALLPLLHCAPARWLWLLVQQLTTQFVQEVLAKS
jgi:hypothetical protein